MYSHGAAPLAPGRAPPAPAWPWAISQLRVMASAALTLIGSAKFRPFRNVWLLEELGVQYKHIPATPRSTDTYEAGNPFGKVPTLTDGSFSMYESAAINTYLADKCRGRVGCADLVPTPGTPTRGRYEQLVQTISMELDAQGLWIHRKHEALAGMLAPAAPEAVKHARAHAAKVVGILATELIKGRGEYLIGNAAEGGDFGFSAADCLFVHCLNWSESIGWADWAAAEGEQFDALRAYAARCRARPAYIKAKAAP